MNKIQRWNIENMWEKISAKYYLEKDSDSSWKNIFLKHIQDNYSKQKDGKKSLIHDDFFFVQYFDFSQSREIVFENEYGDNRSGENKKNFYGLKKQQIAILDKKPIYLVDNHNKALYGFWEVLDSLKKSQELCTEKDADYFFKEMAGQDDETKISSNSLEKKFYEKINIVHIDAHRDDAIFQHDHPEKIDEKNISWCLQKTRVSDYLDLAQKSSLIGEVKNITQLHEFDEFLLENGSAIFQQKPYILNLDIDIFGPEGKVVETKIKLEAIAKAWKNAVAVVIATSPGYISHKDAKALIEILIKKWVF